MKGPSHSQGPQAGPARRRRWGWLLPLLVGAAFLAEIAFLGRLDMAKNAEAVESWTTSFYRRPSAWNKAGGGGDDEIRRCVERLEREDAVPYDRDFDKDPVLVGGAAKVSCLPFSSSPRSI
jgi:glycoprotein 3-alpha-L-fucosyltransferase